MGTPPAPPYATLYFAIHENAFLPEYADNLQLYRRFIDDVIGIWLVTDPATDAETWNQFRRRMNDYPGLEWEFSDRSREIDFMDLSLSIENGKLVTTLYEKPLNLHLYIPPHSAHPPGLLTGVVYGSLFRIHTLCSSDDDRRIKTRTFFRPLLARGYKRDKLLPLFTKAITRARTYSGPELDNTSDSHSSRVFLHLQYHPNDPPSPVLQRAWRSAISHPRFGHPFENLQNHRGKPFGINRLIVAYSRPPNLGNLLSYRKLSITTGPQVSSYRTRGIGGPGERDRERERERARERELERERESQNGSVALV